ncbi:MAG: leishmanolysin-related zinc metalloendopeptidase [Deinococcus sp.]|uniref:leishmanolysin-related zinc metalloendopeptidase n=1 Tax=Deinococcus sp. TaxID=47478 RepID=UPI0026DD9679|nr:leishmanolysin-related zinc metalloendopeptidase [Deinococcus sp.]MDO4246701.1 leishmanolysin-related zinc metalloendopeptidase [Deinococcus sp.]
MNAKWPTLSLLALSLTLGSCGQPAQQSAVTAPAESLSALPEDPYASLSPLAEQGRKGGTTTSDPYNITLNFAPGSDSRVVSAMNAAATRWQGIVTQGLSAVNVNIPAGNCGSNPAFSGTVDDILVFTGSKSIDGPGGVLAQSGPCSVRSSGGLTVYSTLIFDSADLDGFASQLTDIAVHELGHSLGLGSLWSYKGLTSGAGTTDPRYLGTNGNREYAALGGTLGQTPEENTGGSGTAEAHWRERTFGNELMTGYLGSGSNPLSRLSIAGLADLGYSVDYSKADSYSASTLNSLSTDHHFDLAAHEEVLRPKWQVK